MTTLPFRYVLSAVALALLLLPSCSTTRLTSVWRNAAYQSHPTKIMIIALLQSPGNRRLFEDEMVTRLKAVGTDAVVSYAAIPEQAGVDRETIIATMSKQGADAVLISRFMDKRSVTTYVPGSTGPAYPAGYRGGWYDYYSYTPGPAVQDEFVVIQTNLYDLKSDKLIWTAASETWMKEDQERLIGSFIKVIIERLVNDKMLSAGTTP